ncbi:Zn-dependent protease with chaperone function PA4632 [hydrothermal vent metagenome]|uniref:Zn-dependent protease with chaperone function PA4632 n=1 Tax=hydrothermal vent metagenome TaxID=652676 RepID=A0A3B1BIL4_9ZZZZ
MKLFYRLRIYTLPFLAIAISSFFFISDVAQSRGKLILIDRATELKMGEEAYKEILSKAVLSTDSRLTGAIRSVGGKIARVASEPKFNWEFNLIEEVKPNAFCLPGGKVGVNTGILPIAKTEAGLAAVMGHEVAHAIARHGAERMSHSLLINFIGNVFMNRSPKYKRNRKLYSAAYGFGAAVIVTLPFSRKHELEADDMGLIYMAKAGYDPREAKKFWIRFAKYGKNNRESDVLSFLSTHPPDSERIARIEKLLPKALEVYEKSAKIGAGTPLL